MIHFKEVTIEGFSSIIQRATYRLDIPGINIIRGLNGSGKTTILNALSWGLFGKTIKKDSTIKPWPEVCSKDYLGTQVVVKYTKDGKPRTIIHMADWKGEIEGDKGKNRLLIYVGKKFKATLRDKKDGWKWVIDDLGWDFDLFKTSVVFGQKVKRILEEDGPKRNAILEKAFEVSYISQAKNKIDQKLRDSKPLLEGLTNEAQAISKHLQDLTDLIEETTKSKQIFKNDQNRAIEALRAKIEKAKSELSSLSNSKGEIKQISQKIAKIAKSLESIKTSNLDKLKDTEFRLNLEINTKSLSLEKSADKLSILRKQLNTIPTVCSKCKAPLNPKQIKKQKEAISIEYRELVEELKSLKSIIGSLKREYTTVTKELASLESLKDKIYTLTSKKSRLEAKLDKLKAAKYTRKYLTEQLTYFEVELAEELAKKFKGNLKGLKKKAKKAKKELKTKNTEIRSLRQEVQIQEWLVKDPLSNSGLKAFIFATMLKRTNQELRKYSNILNFDIEMSIHLSSKRKELGIHIYRDGHEVPHSDLSGGEAQLADVCIAFAIHDTISDTKGCNLLIMDEIFESLDKNNVEKVGELLAKKSKDKAIHIITHIPYFNPIGANITLVEKVLDRTIITAAS